MRARATAIALAVLLIPATAADAASRQVPRGFYGVNYGGNVELLSSSTQGKLWDRLAQSGSESARVLFNWALAQPSKEAAIDWSRIDALVANAVTRRMSVLPVVEYAPEWARRYPDQVSSPPKHVGDYGSFLRQCVARYGPGGSFWSEHPELPRKPLREWEAWNEPEIAFHWYRTPFNGPWEKGDAKAYAALLRRADNAIHEADHGARLVLAALSIDSWRNLEKLYKWTDVEGHFDVAAIQAYSGATSFIPTLMRRFRSVLDGHGASNVPIFVTEMTWPAAKGKANPHYTTGYMSGFLTDVQGAAERLRKGHKILRGMRSELNLRRVYWYTAATAYAGNNEFEYSGLLTLENGKPKALPVMAAYRRSAKAAEGCAKSSKGECK